MDNGDSTANNAKLFFPLDSGNTENVQIGIDQNKSTLSVLYGGGFGALQMNTLVLNSQTQSPGNPSTCALQTDQFGDLNVIMPVGASLDLTDRNLRVSTINGAPPGTASVPDNLTVSTLNVSQGNDTTGINMRYADGTSTIEMIADSGTYFNQIKPSLLVTNNLGSVVALGADIVAGGLGLVGTGGNIQTQIAGYISGNGTGGIGISSLTVSSINGQAPGGGSATSSFNQVFTSSIGSIDPVSVDFAIVGASGTATIFDMSTADLVQVELEQAGNLAGLSFSSPGGVPTLSVGPTLGEPDIPVNISTLIVSTVNGAAYPPTGGVKIQSGTVPAVGGTTGFVTFPTAFNTVPAVVITPEYDPTAPGPIYISSMGITTTLVNLVAGPTPGTSVIPPFSWVAIGT
jgi:hypothetical protein